MVSAFIEGAHSVPGARVLVTAKHFPGHGDTAVDTHMNLASIPGDREHLEKIEWAPFRAAIATGVDSIMSAHLAVPAIDDPGLPATLSSKLLTGVLREQLGFHGIIVTDALEMGGIAQGFSAGDAAVRALQAGADVLLMPPDPEAAINAVAAAIRSGTLTQARIDESAMRILTAKARIGLGAKRLVDVAEIPKIVNTPESNAIAQEVADRAVTLVRNHDHMFPIRAPLDTAFFLLTESRNGVEGLAMAMEIRRRAPGLTIITMDPSMTDADMQQAIQSVSGAKNYVVAAFVSVAAYRGNVALNGAYPALLQGLLATRKPVALISLGNPYLLRSFPEVAAYMTTYSSVPPSEIAAVKAMFGEMTVDGKLPVTIPDLAKRGEGIRLKEK